MKTAMMLVFVDADHAGAVEQLFEDCAVPGYTEIPNVLGKGATGRKLGNRAFPGSSTLFVVAVDETCRTGLETRLRTLRETRGPDEGLKVFLLDAEELL